MPRLTDKTSGGVTGTPVDSNEDNWEAMYDGNAATVIGRHVGNYVVERTLAQGGMGSVFVARHPALGREAAVKFLGQDVEAPPELTKRFLDEARITANLRHPNIVDIFDFGELDGRLYYVMELLEGRDLSALMRVRRRFTADEVIDCMEQICSGLAAAHAVGVVHRDLKPGNIFVVRGDPPRLKLMDFGVAKIMSTQGEQTRYGQIIGTPRYMSPEQALGQIDRITPQSDIYSLGIIAYEMLAGVAPFEHDSPVMLLVMHVRDAARPIAELADGVSPELAQLIAACLAKDPKDRPASAQEILDLLGTWRPRSDATERQDAPRRTVSKSLVEALNAAPDSDGSPQTKEHFVDADTVLGTPTVPAISPVIERALEVISQRGSTLSTYADTSEPNSANANASDDGILRATGAASIDKTLGPALSPQPAPSPAAPPTARDDSNDATTIERSEQLRSSGRLRVAEPMVDRRSAPNPLAEPAAPAPERSREGNVQPPARDNDRAWAKVQLRLDAPTEEAHPRATIDLTESDRHTLNKLLSRMQRRNDFPAFVQNVGEVSKRADFEGSFSAQQLGASILKDYALTAKLLRVVNSTYANRFGGKVYSVQHAIVILGFDRVRSLALSISLFKSQGKKEHAERISESAINSLVSGEIARQLHDEADVDDPERATVCSIFRNLGKHLVLVYLPEMYDEIVALMRRDGLSLNQASERVLGISLHKMGVGVAERWRLPPKIMSAMSTIPERTGKLRREEDRLASLADFSNQLCEIVASDLTGDERSTALKALLHRHGNLIRLQTEDLTTLLHSTQQSFERRYTSLMGAAAKSSRFARGVATLSGQDPVPETPHPVIVDSAATNLEKDRNVSESAQQRLALAEPTPVAAPHAKPRPKSVLRERAKPQIARLQLAKSVHIDEASERAEEHFETSPLNVAAEQCLAEFASTGPSEPLVVSLLTALQRYLKLPRILALRATLNRRELTIVGGIGEDVDGLAKELRIPLSAARTAADPFWLAFHSNRDALIEDVFSPKSVKLLPQRYYEAIGSTSLAILACNAKGEPPLVLVMDFEPPLRMPTNEQLAALATVRQVLAKVAPTVNH